MMDQNHVTALFLELWKKKLSEGESFQVRLSGTSMKPFIQSGQEGEVLKVSSDRISIGSVILYEKNTPHGERIFAHRVVFKRREARDERREGERGGFITKGDSIFSVTKVYPEEVLGQVQTSERFSFSLYAFTWLTSLARYFKYKMHKSSSRKVDTMED